MICVCAFAFLGSMFPQQPGYFITGIICQRCDRFGRYPSEEDTTAHIDGKIDYDVHWSAHANAVAVIVNEYIQGLHNQKLPYNQSKAFFS